jgi:hypothetical protein
MLRKIVQKHGISSFPSNFEPTIGTHDDDDGDDVDVIVVMRMNMMTTTATMMMI